LQFVSEFRYLGYIINNQLKDDGDDDDDDDDDSKREIRNLFMKTTVLFLFLFYLKLQDT